MAIKGFGTLANLAKILEDALNPDSQVREDKRESKPTSFQKDTSTPHKKKTLDPKRKAWYEKRLQEQTVASQPVAPIVQTTAMPSQSATRKTAAGLSGGLLSTLAAVKEAKPKDGSKRPEAWKRKPGDPIF
jgi:hypothetical protein